MIGWAAEPFESPINKKKRNTNNKCWYFSFLAEARGFAPQTMFAITPVSQTAVSSAVWSARCGEIIIG